MKKMNVKELMVKLGGILLVLAPVLAIKVDSTLIMGEPKLPQNFKIK